MKEKKIGKRKISLEIDGRLYDELKKWAIDRKYNIGTAIEEALTELLYDNELQDYPKTDQLLVKAMIAIVGEDRTDNILGYYAESKEHLKEIENEK